MKAQRSEYSAGGLVYRKIQEDFLILVIKDPKGKWTFPKGLIEKNEDSLKSAIREIKEESGIQHVKFINKLDTVQYYYHFKGILIHKKVDYFLFKSTRLDKLTPQKEEGISQVKFIPLKKLLQIIGYKQTNLAVLRKFKDEAVKLES